MRHFHILNLRFNLCVARILYFRDMLSTRVIADHDHRNQSDDILISSFSGLLRNYGMYLYHLHIRNGQNGNYSILSYYITIYVFQKSYLHYYCNFLILIVVNFVKHN